MSQDITALRKHLFDTLKALKENKIDLETAKAVNDISKTLVDTGRVEVEYLRVTGGDRSTFLAGTATTSDALPRGVTGVTVHRIT